MTVTDNAGAMSYVWLHTSGEGFLRHGTTSGSIRCRVATAVTA